MDERTATLENDIRSTDAPHRPAEVDPTGAPDRSADALIREARRRARRRHAIVISVVVVLVAALVTALLGAAGNHVSHPPKRRAPSPTVPAGGLRVQTLRFSGPFVPQQVVAAGGQIWLLGSMHPQEDTDCALAEVAPGTLATRTFALPQCADDIVAGGGQIFLLTDTFVPHTAATRQLRVEVFDPVDHQARVLAPVDLTMIGSAIAHQALAYGDGSLWLYGHNGSGGTVVVQISPSNGAVLTSTSAVPMIGGVFPSVVANAGGLWLAGGPAGSATIELFRPGPPAPIQISVGPPAQSAIAWIAGEGDQVWAEVEDLRDGAPGTTPAVTLQLVAFDLSGRQTVSAPLASTDDFPVVATPDAELWTVGATCNGTQHLLEVSAKTGVSHGAASLKSPLDPCLYGADGSQLAATGRSVFVLDPVRASGGSVLFRVQAPRP